MTAGPALRLAALGFASFLVFLVGAAPATVVTRTLADAIPGLAFEGVGGSMWTGHARGVSWYGRSVGGIDWSVEPGAIAKGRVVVRFGARGPGLDLDARLDRMLWSGRSEISEVDGALSFATVRRLAGAYGPVDGHASIAGAALTFEGGRPVALSGRVVLSEVIVTVPSPTPLGDFVLDLGIDGGRLYAAVADDSPALAANGTIHIDPGGRWDIDLQVRARTPDARLAAALGALGPPDTQGFRRLELSGGR